jgi:putative iron-regulated protein
MNRKRLRSTCFAALLFTSLAWSAIDEKAVIEHSADLAHAIDEDALTSVRELQQTVDRLIAEPTASHLQQARTAWAAACVSHQQSEAYRFGNTNVDDGEGVVKSKRCSAVAENRYICTCR